jgi:hypothetical protein
MRTGTNSSLWGCRKVKGNPVSSVEPVQTCTTGSTTTKKLFGDDILTLKAEMLSIPFPNFDK